jgi:eukaryotic-like serine/threonine-protein kinase
VSALAKDELIDGKYRIVRFLGKGAWASVYEGINIRLHRRVAIKVLGKETLQHPGVIERFEREGQAATQIESDHVIDIFDIGTLEDGRPYMVMEFLDGEDLARTFEKSGILPPERAVFYVVQALTGLGAAHDAGVLHRDIKPANVVLVKKADREVVKIVDFGISKLHSGAVPQASAMTQTNAVLGSPVYMSPEQCRGARLMDHRSDLYSLGVVLYEALTGKVPHIADTFNALMFKIALEDVPDPRTHRADLDAGLAEIILKALARDTEKRYQSALEFRSALVNWADERGFDPANWAIGSVRNIVAASKSGATPKTLIDGEDAKSTRMLTDSGERNRKSEVLSDSQEREKAKTSEPAIAVTADPVPSLSRPTEPSAKEPAPPNRLPMMAGIGGLVVVAIIAFIALRKSDPSPDTKTGLVATSTASASATTPPTPTDTAPPPSGTTSATTSVAASASPPETASAAPTTTPTPTTPAVTHVGTRPIGVGTPRTTPSASASTAAKTTPSSPAASASAKAVIDGRTIHTNF